MSRTSITIGIVAGVAWAAVLFWFGGGPDGGLVNLGLAVFLGAVFGTALVVAKRRQRG